MTILIIGIMTAFNLIILRLKFSDGRYGDMALDFLALATLSAFFGQTLGGMMIAIVSGTIISLYLYVFPPEFG